MSKTKVRLCLALTHHLFPRCFIIVLLFLYEGKGRVFAEKDEAFVSVRLLVITQHAPSHHVITPPKRNINHSRWSIQKETCNKSDFLFFTWSKRLGTSQICERHHGQTCVASRRMLPCILFTERRTKFSRIFVLTHTFLMHLHGARLNLLHVT